MKKATKSECGTAGSCGCGDAPVVKAKSAKVKAAPAKKGGRCAPRKRCGS
ncbi:hypothetical protein PLCT2_01958 [Planctomycetaceae bacterium]|nr:hypothetical protein PLCT2_01958 [Planctomycetaceae bacterium]